LLAAAAAALRILAALGLVVRAALRGPRQRGATAAVVVVVGVMLLAATAAPLIFALNSHTKGQNMDVGLIKDGLVENVICADSIAKAKAIYPGYLCVERTAKVPFGPGYLYDAKTGKFTEAVTQ